MTGETQDLGPVVAAMQQALAEAGLAPAPIPASLAPQLVEQEPWCWTTREIQPIEMYMFGKYIFEALAGDAAPYVAVSHAGHGMNSYSINYHLVLGRLALFMQVLWGGVYTDADASAAEVADRFAKIRTLLGLAEASVASDAASRTEGPWLIVAESRFRGVSVCALVPEDLSDPQQAADWLRAHQMDGDPLDEAIANW